MPARRLWAWERGALWAMTLDRDAPAPVTLTGATFGETTPATVAQVAAAMELAEPCVAMTRFAAGSRCFVAQVKGEIASYGWVSRGIESIGELERSLRMRPDEAYIWDCATLPAFRRRGLYSALLRHIAAALREEGVHRLWIGASVENHPSLRGFATAGFRPAVRVTFIRALALRHFWVRGAAGAPAALVADARSALVDPRTLAESGIVAG